MKESVTIGDATLYCGDCRDILPTLERVNAVVTDPPYGIGFTGRVAKYRNEPSYRRASTYASYEDTPENWHAIIKPAIEKVLTLADAGAVFCSHDRVTDMPAGMLGAFFMPNGCGMSAWGFTCLMPFMLYGKCPYLAAGMGGRPTARYGVYGNDSNDVAHPCAKPVRAMEWLVGRVSLADTVILDPFMGSGTTGIACAKLGRSFVGIEIDTGYFDIACRRIEEAYREPRLALPEPVRPIQAQLW